MNPKYIKSAILFWATLVHSAICQTATAQGAEAPADSRNSPGASTKKTKVALVRLANRPDASTWPAAEKRIEQELSLSNLTVSTFERRHKEDASLETVLDSVLRESAARGAVLVAVEKDEGVRLHALFYNRDRRIPEYRTHFLALSATSDNVEVAAIKAREAVLATLYEGIPSSFTDDGTLEKSAPSSASFSHPSPSEGTTALRRFRLYGAFGAVWPQGGVGVMGAGGGGVEVRLPRGFVLGADGWISVPDRELEAPVGKTSVRLISFRSKAVYLFQRLGLVQPAAGVRIGILHVRCEGTSDTHPVAEVSTTLFHISGFAEVAFEIAERLSLPISLDVGAFAPGVDILFAQSRKAALNGLMIEVKIGIGVWL